MKCPKCDVILSISDRQGIEIDFCPQCRGVWLDRGELDKIIERANEPSGRLKKSDDDDDRRRYSNSDSQVPGNYDEHYARRHKKKSLLGDLFDF